MFTRRFFITVKFGVFVSVAAWLGGQFVAAAELKRDVEYGRAGDVSLKLDVSVPDGDGPFPVAILVHGGGWSSGDKAGAEKPGSGADITPWFAPLTAAKFTWFSINYRLAPASRWPACFDDVQTAIRWVKAHAAEFKGDPTRIALFGHSAGGHLAFLAAVRADDDTRVQAVVGYAPVTDFEQELPRRGGLSKSLQDLHGLPKEMSPSTLTLLRETSPITHLSAKLPPFLILHGDADVTVPLQQTLNFQSRVRATGGTCDLIEIPGAPHRLTEWDQHDPHHAAKMLTWLNAHLGERLRVPIQSPASSPPTTASTAAPASATPLRLWYREPATHWTEALPVGNGRLGAMIFGGPINERLQLNDDTLWSGRPHAYQHEGAAKYLPEIRRLLMSGKQEEAEALASREFMSVPLHQEMYQPLGDLLVHFPGQESVTEYQRDLDLDTAIARVRYHVGEVGYERSTFASHPDHALVEHVTADQPGRVSFVLRLATPHAGSNAHTIDENTLRLSGQVRGDGLRFATQVRVVADGGHVTTTDVGITVDHANSATLLITTATSFKTFQDISGDPDAAVAACSDAAAAHAFTALRDRHIDDYQSLFRRMSIDLGTSTAAGLPTDERLAETDKTRDPQLAALYFQYGRYLLIASSRGGDQPANLQGIWNDLVSPPWGSKYTVNINTEMNYWPAEVANLSECTEPLWAMLDDLVISGRETARAHYGARGWVLHHNTDLWRGTAPINASNHGIWPTGGAWLCRNLWEHYLFTGDREFLAKRAYPVMKEAALFFIDYLVRDPKTGLLVSGPSNSPEQGGLVMGPSMDHQIIRSLFSSTADAAETLGVDAEFAKQIRKLHDEIAPNHIGSHGQLQEWLEDVDDPNSKHRHVSHLWAVFPGDEITPQTPEFFAAAKQSLIFRGDGGTGWSLGWKIAFWARFLDGDHAHRMLLRQLAFVPSEATSTNYVAGGGTYPNLFDAHPPFQIDGNFAATAGICEMLLQSQARVHTGDPKATDLDFELNLLPALPKAWPAGSIKGLRARGGVEVDLSWRESKLVEAVVRAPNERVLHVRYGGRAVDVKVAAGVAVHLDQTLAARN